MFSKLECLTDWLLDAGLSLLNLSLDTLRPERFERMTRRRGHDRVLETLDLALSLGFDPVKVKLRRIAIGHFGQTTCMHRCGSHASVPGVSLPLKV